MQTEFLGNRLNVGRLQILVTTRKIYLGVNGEELTLQGRRLQNVNGMACLTTKKEANFIYRERKGL